MVEVSQLVAAPKDFRPLKFSKRMWQAVSIAPYCLTITKNFSVQDPQGLWVMDKTWHLQCLVKYSVSLDWEVES